VSPLSFDLAASLTPLSHDSAVIGDLKCEYLGEFATVVEIIRESVASGEKCNENTRVRKSREIVPL
jgi:hypothetical protein